MLFMEKFGDLKSYLSQWMCPQRRPDYKIKKNNNLDRFLFASHPQSTIKPKSKISHFE